MSDIYVIDYSDPKKAGFQVYPGAYNGPGNVVYVARTGNLSNGSPIVTNILPSTAGLVAGQSVGALGVPTNSIILTVDSPSQITLDQNATLTTTNSNIRFGEIVAENSLRMYGRGALEWGEAVDENQLRMNEHWSAATSPPYPAGGQMWLRNTLYWKSPSAWWYFDRDATAAPYWIDITLNIVTVKPLSPAIGDYWYALAPLPTDRDAFGDPIEINQLYMWGSMFKQAAPGWLKRVHVVRTATPVDGTDWPDRYLMMWDEYRDIWAGLPIALVSEGAPSTANEGDLWYNTADNTLYVWDCNRVPPACTSPAGPVYPYCWTPVNQDIYVNSAGDRMCGVLYMNANQIKELAAGTDPTDAVNLAQLTTLLTGYLKLDGTNAMLADLNVGGNKLINVDPGTAGTDGVNVNQLNSSVATAASAIRLYHGEWQITCQGLLNTQTYGFDFTNWRTDFNAANPSNTVSDLNFVVVPIVTFTKLRVPNPGLVTGLTPVDFGDYGGVDYVSSSPIYSPGYSDVFTLRLGSQGFDATTGTTRSYSSAGVCRYRLVFIGGPAGKLFRYQTWGGTPNPANLPIASTLASTNSTSMSMQGAGTNGAAVDTVRTGICTIGSPTITNISPPLSTNPANMYPQQYNNTIQTNGQVVWVFTLPTYADMFPRYSRVMSVNIPGNSITLDNVATLGGACTILLDEM